MKYRFADVVIDSFAHCVMHRAQVVRVTNIEFRLLEYLAQNADQTMLARGYLEPCLGTAISVRHGHTWLVFQKSQTEIGFDW